MAGRRGHNESAVNLYLPTLTKLDLKGKQILNGLVLEIHPLDSI